MLAAGDHLARQRAGFERDELVWALRRPVSWCSGGGEPAPPHAGELLGDTTTQALATLPLLAQDRVIGSLNVGRAAALPFSAWDLAVLEPVRHATPQDLVAAASVYQAIHEQLTIARGRR